MTQYLTSLALDGTSIHPTQGAPGMGGEPLERLVMEFRSVEAIISRLKQRFPINLSGRLLYQTKVDADILADEAKMSTWVNAFVSDLTEQDSGGMIFTGSTTLDPERQVYLPSINIRKHGIDTSYMFGYEFFMSIDYNTISSLAADLEGLIEDGGFVKRGEKVKQVDTFVEALDWLVIEAKRGLYIQRYKGLGEMNPEQLWETTMDPDSRRMLQVTIEDAVAADQLFSTLMGDQVEPRRNFIESNALNVANLDV